MIWSEQQHAINTVRHYLEPYQPTDYRLNAVVQSDREGVRSYDYFGRLADAENDIEDHEQLKISLVPVLPG